MQKVPREEEPAAKVLGLIDGRETGDDDYAERGANWSDGGRRSGGGGFAGSTDCGRGRRVGSIEWQHVEEIRWQARRAMAREGADG